MIKVLFFGPVAERAGTAELAIAALPELTLGTLREQLAARYPEAFSLVALVAVDGSLARDFAQPLVDGSEVVFMSKFSGG